ncbi:MAG TPA: hypothetical protein DCS30_12025 [Rhizobiales bacterium]|nr:hypothetical protein [Hyphomicrobiales bacterium]
MMDLFDHNLTNLSVAITGQRTSGKSEIASAVYNHLSHRYGQIALDDVPVYCGQTSDHSLTIFDVPALRDSPDAFARCVSMADLCVVILNPQQGLDEQVKEQILALHWLDIENLYFAVCEDEDIDPEQLNEFVQEIYDFIWGNSIDSEYFILVVSTSNLDDIFDLPSNVKPPEENDHAGHEFRLDILAASGGETGNYTLWGKVKSGSASIGTKVELQANGHRHITHINKAGIFGRDTQMVKVGNFITLELATDPDFLMEPGCILSSPDYLSYRSCFDRVSMVIFTKEETGEEIEIDHGQDLDICFGFGAITAEIAFPHIGDNLGGGDSLVVRLSFSKPIPAISDDQCLILHNRKIIGMGRIC